MMENTTQSLNATGASNATSGPDGAVFNCSLAIPNAQEMLVQHMSQTWSSGLLITASILSLLTCAIFIEASYTTTRSVEYGTRRGYTLFILGLVPVFSVTSLTGIFIPKAAVVGIWASTVYLSVSLYLFLMLIFNYFGGPEEMVSKLAELQISLSQPPLACCFPCCCRKISITTTNLHRLRVAVLQMAVIFPLAYFITAILWADGQLNLAKLDLSSPSLYLTIAMLISTLVAMYALTIINVATDHSLAEMYGRFRLRFSLLKFFMIVPNLQGLVVGIISMLFVYPCTGPMALSIRAPYLNNLLLILEMFLLLTISRCKWLINQHYGQLRPVDHKPDSLPGSQTGHRYAEMQETVSPLLDSEGNKPSFPSDLLDPEVGKVADEDRNHNEQDTDSGDGSPAEKQPQKTDESNV